MKTSLQNPPSDRLEEPSKDCEEHNDPRPSCSKDVSTNAGDGPSQVLAWVANASKEFTPKLGALDIKGLENFISLYLTKVSSSISRCYVPNRAAKMKRYMSDVLMFFSFLYQEIADDEKACSTFLDTMTELMVYYIDMEIQASSRAKENPLMIATKLTSSLFIFLDKSHNHILDSLLKAHNLNKNFWELCSLIFSGVLKDTPNTIMTELTYVRYILAYKMWKRVVQGPDERKRVMSLASVRLKTPPHFVEKIRAGLLNGIIPKVPKKRCDVTTFLLQAKFDVKEKAKAFLKYVSESKVGTMFVPAVPAIKTDIPLLVGYSPDFGPSLSLVKLDAPNLDEDTKQEVVTGTRLMNDVWTSVNHEASFREAVRMQNVTTFNRIETKVSEKKKIHCVLKNKKVVRAPEESKILPEDMQVSDSVDKPQAEGPDDTIVLSDDSEKGNSETVEVPRKSRVNRVSKSPPVVRMKQERMSPTPAKQKRDMSPPSKEGPTEVVPAPAKIAKRPLINPSQIKQEIENDDCIILENIEPPPATEQEAVADKGKEVEEDNKDSGTAELDVSVSLKKADICQPSSPYMVPISDRFTKETVLNDRPCDLKEEKVLEIPNPEKEINIRINRDLFEKIKCKDECQKEVATDDVPPKSVETSLPNSDNVDVNGKDGFITSSTDNKSDTALFDDEENSWSPSGGCQEVIRNVVDSFITHYFPVDEVDPRLSGSNVAADHTLKTIAVVGSKDKPSCESFSDAIDKTAVHQCVLKESSEKIEVKNDSVCETIDTSSPPAKRRRISDDIPSNSEAQVEEIITVTKSTDSNIADKQPSNPNQEEEFTDPISLAVHNNTCRWDHVVFVLQTKLRDALPTNITTPIPPLVEMDPDTGRQVVRCTCNQCAGNHKALVFNHKALVGFQNDVIKASKESGSVSVADTAAVASIPHQFQPKQEPEEDSSGATDDVPQLPLKKRKALVSSDGERRDDTESQHSDTSKDGMSVDYPATPMLSIALLTSRPDSYPSPPLPDSSTHSDRPPLITGVDMSYTSGVTSFSSTSMMAGGYCDPGPSAQPVGGSSYVASTETLNPASLPGDSIYNSAPPRTGFDANYTSSFPGSSFSANPSLESLSGYSGSSTSRPPGGGFPPFTAVVPPPTNFPGNISRLEQHSVDSMASRYNAPSVNDRPSRRSTTTRRFVTPAQLKQAFIAKDARSCREETSDGEPVSYSVKSSTSASETRSGRSKKEPSTSSRKSDAKTKKKKRWSGPKSNLQSCITICHLPLFRSAGRRWEGERESQVSFDSESHSFKPRMRQRKSSLALSKNASHRLSPIFYKLKLWGPLQITERRLLLTSNLAGRPLDANSREKCSSEVASFREFPISCEETLVTLHTLISVLFCSCRCFILRTTRPLHWGLVQNYTI